MRFAVVTAVMLLRAVVPAHADDGDGVLPRAFEFEWDVPARCGSRAQFEADLARQISPAAAALAEPMRIRVSVRPDAKAGWILELSTPVGTRIIQERDCDELLKTLPLILLIAIEVGADPVLQPRPPPVPEQAYDAESPLTGSPVPPEEEEPPVVIRDTPVGRTTGPPIGLAVRAVIGGDAALLPHPSPGVGLAAALVRGPFRVEATTTSWAMQPADNPDDPGEGARLSLWTFGLRGCHDLFDHRVVVAGCAGGELGRFGVEPFGLVRPGVSSVFYYALSGGVGIVRKIWHPVYFRADADLTLVPIKTRITLEYLDARDDSVLHSAGWFSGRALTGLEVRFW